MLQMPYFLKDNDSIENSKGLGHRDEGYEPSRD